MLPEHEYRHPPLKTADTADRRPSAHFEHTAATVGNDPMILTAGPDEAWRFAG